MRQRRQSALFAPLSEKLEKDKEAKEDKQVNRKVNKLMDVGKLIAQSQAVLEQNAMLVEALKNSEGKLAFIERQLFQLIQVYNNNVSGVQQEMESIDIRMHVIFKLLNIFRFSDDLTLDLPIMKDDNGAFVNPPILDTNELVSELLGMKGLIGFCLGHKALHAPVEYKTSAEGAKLEEEVNNLVACIHEAGQHEHEKELEADGVEIFRPADATSS